MEVPETRYAKVGDDRVAYQVFGDGPIDLVYLPVHGDCIDVRWEWPPYADFLARIASFSRVIQFDRRGMGGSDPVPTDRVPTWELWVDDALAVLDAVKSERAAVLGTVDAGPVAALFAATQPDRTHSLILANTAARFVADDDYPWGQRGLEPQLLTKQLEETWGTRAFYNLWITDQATNEAFCRWSSKMNRLACSPKEAAAYSRFLEGTDIRATLSSIRVPTLVLHRRDSRWINLAQGRHLAEHIAGARFVEIPGSDEAIAAMPYEEGVAEIEEFLTGARSVEPSTRVLAAVLFTDIVDSTAQASRLGDVRWSQVLDSHDSVARTVTARHGGRLVKLTGDGILATFDGPGRAIQAAIAFREALAPLGIEIRAGLHTGEIELREGDIGGIGVHVAARVLEQARPGDVVVSGAVPMLVAGSTITFEDRGDHELKGVPGNWRLFAVST
jgi:class 3 adenylate cyclase